MDTFFGALFGLLFGILFTALILTGLDNHRYIETNNSIRECIVATGIKTEDSIMYCMRRHASYLASTIDSVTEEDLQRWEAE